MSSVPVAIQNLQKDEWVPVAVLKVNKASVKFIHTTDARLSEANRIFDMDVKLIDKYIENNYLFEVSRIHKLKSRTLPEALEGFL